ncbi:Uncharacterized protein PBTT_09112 [Plasmodiophora brassicae]
MPTSARRRHGTEPIGLFTERSRPQNVMSFLTEGAGGGDHDDPNGKRGSPSSGSMAPSAGVVQDVVAGVTPDVSAIPQELPGSGSTSSFPPQFVGPLTPLADDHCRGPHRGTRDLGSPRSLPDDSADVSSSPAPTPPAPAPADPAPDRTPPPAASSWTWLNRYTVALGGVAGVTALAKAVLSPRPAPARPTASQQIVDVLQSRYTPVVGAALGSIIASGLAAHHVRQSDRAVPVRYTLLPAADAWNDDQKDKCGKHGAIAVGILVAVFVVALGCSLQIGHLSRVRNSPPRIRFHYSIDDVAVRVPLVPPRACTA